MKKHNFDFSVCRERICIEVAHFHWSGNRMALIRLHRADTHEWESKKNRPSCFTCWVLTPNVRTTKLLCALPQRPLITLCSSVVSVYTHTCVRAILLFCSSSFFLGRDAVMSRYGPTVYRKSVPGEAQEMGRCLTASLSPLIISANQANGRNTDEENNWSQVPPRHLSIFFISLRITSLLTAEGRGGIVTVDTSKGSWSLVDVLPLIPPGNGVTTVALWLVYQQ